MKFFPRAVPPPRKVKTLRSSCWEPVASTAGRAVPSAAAGSGEKGTATRHGWHQRHPRRTELAQLLQQQRSANKQSKTLREPILLSVFSHE